MADIDVDKGKTIPFASPEMIKTPTGCVKKASHF